MKLFSTKVHGVIDYLMSIVLISAPWLFGFARGGAETWVPVALGIGTILYSMITNYELGAIRTLSMRTHLALDVTAGILLALSPVLFGFSDYVYLPHVVLGVIEVGVVLVTDPVPHTISTRSTGERHSQAH